MPYEPLLDAFQGSRRERTHLDHGERSAAIEAEIGGVMDLFRHMHWTDVEGGQPPDERRVRDLRDQRDRRGPWRDQRER